MKNRRTERGYKLRVYLDAIKDLNATSEDQWLDNWVHQGHDAPYLSKSIFLAYLESCVVREAEVLLDRKAA